MDSNKLCNYLYVNMSYLKNIGVNLEFNEINHGDRFYNETGIEFKLILFDTEYNIGYVNIIEDNDHWKKAQLYNYNWCINNQNLSETKIFDNIQNFIRLRRNKIIDSIVKTQKMNY